MFGDIGLSFDCGFVVAANSVFFLFNRDDIYIHSIGLLYLFCVNVFCRRVKLKIGCSSHCQCKHIAQKQNQQREISIK